MAAKKPYNPYKKKALLVDLSLRLSDDRYFYDIYQEYIAYRRVVFCEQSNAKHSVEDSRLEILNCLLANMCWAFLQGKYLAVSFHNQTYKSKNKKRKERELPDIGLRSIREVLGFLGNGFEANISKEGVSDSAKEKIIEYQKGLELLELVKQGRKSRKVAHRSIYRISNKFLPFTRMWSRKAEASSVTLGVERIELPSKELVFLKSEKVNKRTKEVTEETIGYSQFQPKAKTKKSDFEFIKNLNDHCAKFKYQIGDLSIPPPIFERKYKIDFEHHGRIYAKQGHYQTIKSEFLPMLRINGRKTTEWDYSATHPRLAHHIEGFDFDKGDAYSSELIFAVLEGVEEPRDILKKFYNSMLNCSSQEEAIGAIRGELNLNKVKRASRIDGLTTEDLIILDIVKNNPKISHYFFNSKGLKLLYVDSEICVGVLEAFISKGYPILPKHDSFITLEEHEEFLRETMNKVWVDVVRRFGNDKNRTFSPEISKKY